MSNKEDHMIEHLGDPIKMPDGSTVPFSQVVRANGFLFVAGQMGVDAKARPIADDIEAQTQLALDNMEKLLDAAGASLKDVVKVNAWITDAADFAGFNKVYAAKFGGPFPARATVISGLLIPGAKVEIEAVAVAP
jgi:2-iminobutanoate/2-iminopropanoate deaminase